MEELKQHLIDNFIKFEEISDSIVIIDGDIFLFVEPKNDIMILPSFELNLDAEEIDLEENIDYYCFMFGDNFYYTKAGEKLSLNQLKYIGKYDDALDLSIPFIGLHGGYEIMNGSRDYKDWIKKAKFLNVGVLGICERNTLGGVLKFQSKCKDEGIKSIIGEQVVVKDEEDFIQFKCYVKNETGWKNLLLINKEVNITNNGFIEKGVFLKLCDGLFIVIDTKYTPYSKMLPYDLNLFELYYQIDTVEFVNDSKDKEYLLNLKSFIGQDKISPIFINDAYYLDKEDYTAKAILNAISEKRDFKSKNQYFKSIEENFEIFSELFNDDDKCYNLFEKSINNLIKVTERCEFEIQTGVKLLPKYIMSEKDIEKYRDRDSMFWALIQEGLERIDKINDERYINRIQEEYETISLVQSNYGDGIDYFLMSYDIVRFCHENDILVGLGRGSAAGSLIAYLFNITKINPFDYNLLFSRFLNKGRVEKGTIPDFDLDFQAFRRTEVKKYIEDKYGIHNVCSIGTYGSLQLKAAFKALSSLKNVEFGISNYISQLIDVEDGNWENIFLTANSKLVVKNFVMDNPDIIEDIQLILKQPRSQSVHACGMIITPSNVPIEEYIPIRLGEKDGEIIVVSEWEGDELEQAGFLKMDILGITQLDKYKFAINLIKKQTGNFIDIYNIPLDDLGVYELFQNGHNGDIFQLGTKGLALYCKDVKPTNIHELIDVISLYRPGAMDVNAHNEYVLRKLGNRQTTYHWGTENILKDTYGLIVYQEQVMEIVQKLGDFDLIEADDVRRAMGKKKKDVIDKYKEQFISTIISKGCPEHEADVIWHELEVHSGYSFNRSHAAAYAITGYIGQWLKYHYPLQYWSAAFQFDDPNPKKSNLGRFISEIRRTDSFIKLAPLHINESDRTFTSNYDKMELYWSISRVKQVGNVALEAIISEREKNGEFFSLEEFLGRVEKSKVNKAVVINLILSGAFDEIENIEFAGDRKRLINKYYEVPGNKRDKDDIYKGDYEDYWWQIKQKEVSGFGIVDYDKVIERHTQFKDKIHTPGSKIQELPNDRHINVTGIIKDVMVRTTKKNDEFCNLVLDYNNEDINVTIWNETFKRMNIDDIQIGLIFAMNGVIAEYRGNKSVHSLEKSEIYLIS